jgi:hypothetical protein
MDREDWDLARRVINKSKIKWAVSSVRPFKSARTADIVPALLQNGAR